MQQGDSAAYEYLFKAYVDKLFAYAVGLYCDSEAAEDAVQEAFFSLWAMRKKIAWTGSVYPFLRRAVKNMFINNSIREDVKKKYVDETAYTANGIDWDAPNVVEELCEQLWEAIDHLPENCRKIFIMSCVEGLKYQEVAQKLDVSINTVKTQVRIGYKKIREDLGIYQTA